MSVGKASKTSGSNCVQADITQMKKLNMSRGVIWVTKNVQGEDVFFFS
jgi:hypothetical protein